MTRLTPSDIAILKALSSGQKPSVKSSHRLRLEMLGLVHDGPSGLSLTSAGVVASNTKSNFKHETMDRPTLEYDAVGRRRMLRRGHAL